MATVRRLFAKVSPSHRRAASKSRSQDPKLEKHPEFEHTDEPDHATLQNGQANGNAYIPNGSHVRPQAHKEMKLSFTEMKEDRKAEREDEEEKLKEERDARKKESYDRDPLRANYGSYDMTQKHANRHSLISIESMKEGEDVCFRARIHHARAIKGNKIVFFVFRSQIHTVQGVLVAEDGEVSENMVQWAQDLSRESIVFVEGVTQTPKVGGHNEVKSTSVHTLEVKIKKMYSIAEPSSHLPFQVDDAARSADSYDKEDSQFSRVGERTRLNHRILDLRTPTAQAIFRIQSAVVTLFREYLVSKDFTEIHTSKFQEGATESGASVFKVDYFRRNAFLAQSPQLMKQMCIAADMERVFEVGPVFRAENSNTHRHLTEFTGLDLEMAFEADYHEVVDIIDQMFLHIFKTLYRDYREEIDTIKKQFPHEDLVIPDKTLRLKFADGIKLLRESGWREEDGSELAEDDDLSTRAEQRLGQLVKEKYHTDYYILDKFPSAVRPFYTMLDPENPNVSNSYDFFIRGEEILSGGQRIHNAQELERRMQDSKIDPNTMKDYLDGFRWGCPPHGGGGIGLERVVMLLLKLGNIRWATLFPRDPRSFPATEAEQAEAAQETAQRAIVFGPKSSTFTDSRPHVELPPLENLIAKYGDSTNTSWIDPAWTVWRHQQTGAAVGYIPSDKYAVIFGDPLCEPKQVPQVVSAFLHHLESEKLKPVWACINENTEHYLAGELGWSALLVVAEERLDPTKVHPDSDKNFRRKVHRAERDGVKISEIEGEVDQEMRDRLEKRVEDWRRGRNGDQVHLTGVRPFDDMAHRKYFIAEHDGEIAALVVLSQLAPEHGYQVKWALEFPGAPAGSIEYILWHVLKKLGDAGVHSATFGAGARDRLERVENIGGFRVRAMEKTYNGLSSSFNLTNKGDFRSKFGVEQEPLFICYPKASLGMRGVEALMNALKSPK
ncbi:hypothetical protein JAAARDRAFT_43060 [Jaapia argillacea MUCL 33604]|uniref:aspartate--tRNA ligase n=1 Tax=Jaapia argillacea MUCL 33604 TaxID=933084 RepID=A0A067P2M6_9AGAM|nr:hypothetical protein JAAARDRAFT_43060 [Jaapia argillacea MUCL 33604]